MWPAVCGLRSMMAACASRIAATSCRPVPCSRWIPCPPVTPSRWMHRTGTTTCRCMCAPTRSRRGSRLGRKARCCRRHSTVAPPSFSPCSRDRSRSRPACATRCGRRLDQTRLARSRIGRVARAAAGDGRGLVAGEQRLPAAALICHDGMGMAGPVGAGPAAGARRRAIQRCSPATCRRNTVRRGDDRPTLRRWIRLPTHPTASENVALAARSGARMVLGHSCDRAALARLARHLPALARRRRDRRPRWSCERDRTAHPRLQRRWHRRAGSGAARDGRTRPVGRRVDRGARRASGRRQVAPADVRSRPHAHRATPQRLRLRRGAGRLRRRRDDAAVRRRAPSGARACRHQRQAQRRRGHRVLGHDGDRTRGDVLGRSRHRAVAQRALDRHAGRDRGAASTVVGAWGRHAPSGRRTGISSAFNLPRGCRRRCVAARAARDKIGRRST